MKAATITTKDYKMYGGQYGIDTFWRRFGSWFKALELAKLEMSRSRLNISNHELLKDIAQVWKKIGKRPSYNDMTNKKIQILVRQVMIKDLVHGTTLLKNLATT